MDVQASPAVITQVAQAQTQAQAQASAKPQTASAKPKDLNSVAKVENETQENTNTPVREAMLSLGKDTSLRFRVDPEKHQVTVMILDKATNKVIATIPQEAIKDLPPGELLNFQG